MKKLKQCRKRVVSFMLVLTMLIGSICWDNFSDAYNVSAEEVDPILSMPSWPAVKALPKMWVDEGYTDYFNLYNEADYCWYDYGGYDVLWDRDGEVKLGNYKFWGRCSVIGTQIYNRGSYTMQIKLEPFGGYNKFRWYSNMGQLQGRLVYKKTSNYWGSKYSYAGDNINQSGTYMTDWCKTDKLSISADGIYKVSDIMVILADVVYPKTTNYTVSIEDGAPVLTMNCGETIRPVNSSIRQSNLESMQIAVTMVPNQQRDEENAIETLFIAKEIDYNAGTIKFIMADEEELDEREDFLSSYYGSEKAKTVQSVKDIAEKEWCITKIRDAYNTEYTREFNLELRNNTLTNYIVNSPITDMAGNPVEVQTVEYKTGSMILDKLPPAFVSAEMTGSMINSDSSEEIARADMYASIGDSVSLNLIMSEKVRIDSGVSYDNIYLEWNVTDASGNYIKTKLKEVKTISTSANTGNISKLVFESLTIEEGVSGEITPRAFYGGEYISDEQGNRLNVDSIKNAYPDKQIGVDTTGPAITFTDEVSALLNEPTERYYVFPLNITDEQAGLIASDGSNLTQYMAVYASNTVKDLGWQWCITDSLEMVDFGDELLNVASEKQYKEFSVYDESKTYYVHLYMKSNEEEVEIDKSFKLYISFILEDAKQNSSTLDFSSKLELAMDTKAPLLVVTPQAVEITKNAESETANDITFQASVVASDVNDVSQLYYQWVDIGEEPADNQWWTVDEGTVVYEETVEVDGTTSTVSKQLYVKAIDSYENESIYVSDEDDFVAHIELVNARYEIQYDDTKVGGISDVAIYAPVDTNREIGGYTRVTMTMGDNTYVRVFDYTGSDVTAEQKSMLFDSEAKWYLVTIDDAGTYTSVTADQTIAWDEYYGTISISLEAASVDLTPAVAGAVTPEDDATYQAGKTFEMLYTCARNDVHAVTFTGMVDASGNSLSQTNTPSGVVVYKVNQELAGIRYNFSISNLLLSSLNTSDVDFEKSYAIVYCTTDEEGRIFDSDGNLVDGATAVSGQITLTEGNCQSVAIPYLEAGYKSGVYGMVVHIVQRNGGVQDFDLEQIILLDNEGLPTFAGVTEYSRSVDGAYEVNYVRGTVTGFDDVVAEDGAITYIDLGIAEQSNTYTIVYVDGKPAFTRTSSNALSTYGEAYVYLRIETLGTQALGQTLGKVSGIRIWNQASAGDASDVSWSDTDMLGYLNIQDDYVTARMDLNLDWYGENSADCILVDAETLANTNVGDFRLKVGNNIICYQVLLENGKVSPIYAFNINLYNEAPTVEVTYEMGASIQKTDYLYEDDYYYPIIGTEFDRTYANSYAFKIADAYSPNGELYVYHVTFDDENNKWVYTQVDGSASTPIEASNINGYLGIEATVPLVYSGDYSISDTEGIQEFFMVVDEVGNAYSYLPIMNDFHNVAEALKDTDGYTTLRDEETGWALGLEDETTEPIYYFTKDTTVGSLEVSENGTDESCNILSFTNNPGDTVEQVSIRIDGGEEVFLESLNEAYYAESNQAGIIYYDGYSNLYYEFQYDMNKEDGAEIEHTVVVTGYIDGAVATDVNGNEAVTTLTITAENIKPELVQDGTPEVGKAYVAANRYLYAPGLTESEEYGDYATDFAVPMYEDGTFTRVFYDIYGGAYELSAEITAIPADPVVKRSETDLTVGPVTVTVTSASGTFSLSTDYELPENTVVDGIFTSELTIEMEENGYFEVICTYEDGVQEIIGISVDNIYNEPIIPKVIWDYNEYMVDPEDNSYVGEVTATLVDESGSVLTDLATGLVPTYTFVPGGETTYTFTNYVNKVGVVGADVEVTLPITLKTLETEYTESDTYSPDVAITGYAKFEEGTIDIFGAVTREDESRPGYGTDEAIIGVTDYSTYMNSLGQSYTMYDTVDDLMGQVGFAYKYILNLEVSDENDTALILRSDKYAEVPAYGDASDTIEGVSIVGRTLQISKNTEFALHVVDTAGNATSFYFTVTNLGDTAPEPIVVQALTKTNEEVRVYLTNPNLKGVSGLKITNTGVLKETDVTSNFYGMDYLSFTENYPNGFTIFYEYTYAQQLVSSYVVVYITELDMTTPQLTKTEWSGNYDATGVTYTNQDVTAQLTFSKPLRDAYFVDEDGSFVAAPEGVELVYLEDRVTVLYENNAEALRLYVVAANSDTLTNVYELPAVTTIDKTPAELTAEVTLSDNHRKATITVTSDEDVTWPNGISTTTYTQMVKANEDVTYTVADKAGNVTKYTVSVTDVIEEDLSIALSTNASDDTIFDPATYTVDIGDTIYVKTNRSAFITMNDSTNGVSAKQDVWTEITIQEDSEGIYPAIHAVDAYGNTAVVQLLQIPMRDRVAPTIYLVQNQVSASLDATEDELEAILKGNYIASDDVTAAENLKFSYELPQASTAGTYAVTYYVEDEAGNVASKSGWIRFYNGEEIQIMVNGEKVERDATMIVSSGTQVITITHNGEPYKVEWRIGLKSLGQMKNNANVLTEYTEAEENELTIELTSAGYYTFLVTTQGRDTYRFVVYVEE